MSKEQKDLTIKLDKGFIDALIVLTIIGLGFLTISWNSTMVIFTAALAYWYGKYGEKITFKKE